MGDCIRDAFQRCVADAFGDMQLVVRMAEVSFGEFWVEHYQIVVEAATMSWTSSALAEVGLQPARDRYNSLLNLSFLSAFLFSLSGNSHLFSSCVFGCFLEVKKAKSFVLLACISTRST
jgi:hypothetical protein